MKNVTVLLLTLLLPITTSQFQDSGSYNGSCTVVCGTVVALIDQDDSHNVDSLLLAIERWEVMGYGRTAKQSPNGVWWSEEDASS